MPGGSALAGEVAEEARMLPQRQAGQHDPVEIGDHRAEILRLLRRSRWQQRAHLARPGPRHHRPIGQPFLIVGQPVDQPVMARSFRAAGQGAPRR